MTTNGEYLRNSKTIKSPRSRRKLIRNIIIGLVGFAACGAIVVTAGMLYLLNLVSGDTIGLLPSPCDISTPAGIEEIAEFKFPPSAKLLTSGCGGMQGWSAQTSFEMNPSELSIFLATTGVKARLSAANKPEKLHCACADNEKITDYLYGTYTTHNGNHSWFEEVFIDTHDKNLYTVYFTVLGG